MSTIHLFHTYYKLSKDILRLLIKKKSHFKHFFVIIDCKVTNFIYICIIFMY